MKRQSILLRRIVILIFIFLITLSVILVHRHIMVQNIEEQLLNSMDDVSYQNKVVIEKELAKMQTILASVGREVEGLYPKLETKEELEAVVDFLRPFAEIYHFKRMGVVALDGEAFCTDGYYERIAGHDVLVLGSKGIANITGAIEDTIGVKEPINVLSIPIYDSKKQVMAVLFATVRTEEFRKLINVEPFEGLGYSYIIQKDGTVVTDSEQSPMYGTTNIFDSMLSFTDKNAEMVDTLKAAMESSTTGHGFAEAEGKRYIHYAPLDIENVQQGWYLCTIVTSQIMEDRIDEVLDLYDKLLAVAALIVIFAIAYYVHTCGSDEKTLRTLAYVDSVTEGDNYACFTEKYEELKPDRGYFISMDLNDFKLVNTICGIKKGDETLRKVWQAIEDQLGEGELAARMNADHYVLFLNESSRTEFEERMQELSAKIGGIAGNIGVISIWPYFGIYELQKAEDAETCFGYANQAKHLVRGKRKQNYAFYERSDYDKLVAEKKLVDQFEGAIANGEFEMWYQPKYKSNDQTVVGAEALVRWRKEDGTMRQPLDFIPLFERNGLIATLDEHVFKTVCMQQKKWEKEGKHIFPISVNISRASLYYDDIIDRYKKILEDCDIQPGLVPLEITESATVDNSQIRKLVERFRDLGFPIHLDDFGNGYSALSTLNMMHFDTLKLDKGLVDFIGDSNGEKLLGYTIKLAKSLGMRITAEGVEFKNQVEFLQDLECDEIQGYYFSRPLPLEKFEELIK